MGLLLLSFLTAITVPAATPVAAQDTSGPRVWLAPGVGGGGGFELGAAGALTGQISVLSGHHAFALRTAGVLDVSSVSESITEISVLYGRAAVNEWGHASLSSGLSLVGCEGLRDTPECNNNQISGLGVPIVAEAALHLLPFLGAGLQGFGNLNSLRSYGGFTIFVMLGRVR